MDADFKRRVEAFQNGTTRDEQHATRSNHTLPEHQPNLLSTRDANNIQAGRTTGGAIRTSLAIARSARARGPPGSSGGVINRSVFGPSAAPTTNTEVQPSTGLNRTTKSRLWSSSSPGQKRRASLLERNSLQSAASVSIPGTAGTAKKFERRNISSTNSSKSNINNTANQDKNNISSNNTTTDGAKNISNNDNTQSTPRTTPIPSATLHPFYSIYDGLTGTGNSSTIRSPGLRSPTKKHVYDRYIPVREGGLSELYDLLPETHSTTSRLKSRKTSMTPTQATQATDHYKKAQNQAHDTVIANELQLTNTHNHSDQQLASTPRRLFNYSSTTTHNTIHFDSPSRQIYASTPVSQESRNILLSPKKAPRTISQVPFKILDAPELKDDFYLNLVDWSSQNVLGVGLGNCVYLWSALTSRVTQLCSLGENDSVTSINWISMGSHLAVGTDKGYVQIWDVGARRKVRTLTGHTQRVGVLAWKDHILTSGSRDRKIYHRDVRAQEMWIHQLASHTGEVCGLKWNSSGSQLASGGNDNKLMVWEKDSTVPLYKFRDHTAAVKAIDWNPHQSGVLASGGGTVDRHIRFWNTATGVCLGATDTGSQVCNLAWSKTSNELVSTHGYSQNQVVVWKYPAMHQIVALSGHSMRVLYLALSPDGQTVVTGAGDETLRFWNVFQKSKSERRDDEGLSGVITTIR